MPPKAQRALEWSKDFNNASPTDRIEFLKHVERLDEHERPKLNITSAKKFFDYLINVSACSLSAAWRCAQGAADQTPRALTSAQQHSGPRQGLVDRTQAHDVPACCDGQEAREETLEDVEIVTKPNCGSFRLGLGILYAAVVPGVSWPGPLCRCPCPYEWRRACGLR